MTGIVDLRLHRIRSVAAALHRAGYRTTPPPDAEADQWVCSVEAGEDEHGQPVHRLIWHPRKEITDWQNARFGPFTSSHDDAVEHDPTREDDGQAAKDVADGDYASLSPVREPT